MRTPEYYAIFNSHEELNLAYHQVKSKGKIDFKLYKNQGKNALCRVLGPGYSNSYIKIKLVLQDNILGKCNILLLRKDPIAVKINRLIGQAFELVEEYEGSEPYKLLCEHITRIANQKLFSYNLKNAKRQQ